MHGGEAAPPRPLPHGPQTYAPGAHHSFHHNHHHPPSTHGHNGQQGHGNGQQGGGGQQAFALLSRQYASAPPVPGMHFPGQQNPGPFQPPQTSHQASNGEASSFHGPSSHLNHGPGGPQGDDRSLMDEAFYQGAGALFFKGSAEEDLPEDLRHDEIFSDHEEEEDDHSHRPGSDMVVEEELMMGHQAQHHWPPQQGGQRGGEEMTGMDG